VGLIYGDSITYDRAKAILDGMRAKGWSAENIVFGIGSYTYQNVTRDTHGFAVKATWAQIDGVGVPLSKNPKTDSGTKKSHRGLLAVTTNPKTGEIVTKQDVDPSVAFSETNIHNMLRMIYENGKLLRRERLEDIRRRLEAARITEI
jgi:nicotinamide phosphoribosyltransferase